MIVGGRGGPGWQRQGRASWAVRRLTVSKLEHPFNIFQWIGLLWAAALVCDTCAGTVARTYSSHSDIDALVMGVLAVIVRVWMLWWLDV